MTDAGGLDLEGTFAEFRHDLVGAVGAWRSVVWLPIVSALLGPVMVVGSVGAETADAGAPFASLGLEVPAVALLVVALIALALFATGWSGTERLTYARVWGGEPIAFSEALAATWGYVGRFFILGLVLLVPVLLVTLVLSLATNDVIAWNLTTFLLLVVLTFVAPALVYDEERATRALGSGWRLLRRQGSAAAWYAVVPPAVLTLLTWASSGDSPLAWMGHFFAGLVGLAFKGAIASAYLRLTTGAAAAAPG